MSNETLQNAEVMCKHKMGHYKKIGISISGGADSDLVIDMCERNKNINNDISYVFFDTGLEYQATKEHLKYLEERYKVKIETLRPDKPIPISVRDYGTPFISKHVSDMIGRLQSHAFKWEDKPFDELYKEYPKCKCALKWWCNDHPKGSMFNIEYNKYMKEFLLENNPEIKISDKCCHYNKKILIKKYVKTHKIQLDVTGVRKAEGGKRSVNIKSCFDMKPTYYSFRPIFWFNNKDKEEYNKEYNIVNSDCYSKYGLKRTGCAGCPFGQDFEYELEVLAKYEPKLYKAVVYIFGASYEFTRMYKEFRSKQD